MRLLLPRVLTRLEEECCTLYLQLVVDDEASEGRDSLP